MSFENPIPGSSTTVPRGNSALGGGLPGFIPPSLITTDNYDEFAQTRFFLILGDAYIFEGRFF